MSELGAEPKPARRRAGLLSALSRQYNDAHRLMNQGASNEEINQLKTKLDEQYEKYLESHDLTLAEQPEREPFLVNSHDLNVQRHLRIVDQLEAYLQDGAKPDDIESIHAASLFSRRPSAKKSVAQSCPANLRKANTVSNASQAKSVTLSETRVQAKLAKHKFAQQQAEQQANQRQIDFEREVARQHRELDKRREEAEAREKQLQEDAAQKQLEIKRAALEREHQVQLEAKRLKEELDMRQRQVQLDVERQQRELQEENNKRKRELDRRQKELEEEAELHKRELENAMQLERQKNQMENWQAELRIREREEIRSELGSDYDSDSDCEDVTRPKGPAPKQGFPLESEQNELIQKFLQQITAEKLHCAPTSSATSNPVKNWMFDPTNDIATPAPRVLNDTLHIEQSKNCGYVPPVTGLQKGRYS